MLEDKLLIELKKYVKNHLASVDFIVCNSAEYEEINFSECFKPSIQPTELDDYINKSRKPTFNQVLFSFIDKAGASDAEIYKKAGIDRRHFSKIKSNPDYRPGKNSTIALAIALELNKKDTDKLLSAAGYSLSESDTFDLVIQFCLEKRIYNLHDVNQALDYFRLKPLAGVVE